MAENRESLFSIEIDSTLLQGSPKLCFGRGGPVGYRAFEEEREL
jgi:hypothetical protein